MLLRRDTDWERVTDARAHEMPAGEIEAIADAILCVSRSSDSPDGVERNGFICYVISAGGRRAGVIGVAAPSAPPEVRRTIGTAATLLGIALRNVQLFAEVREHGLRDGLTGCFNRAHGLETLEAEMARARRSETTLSVVMFDVDQFKRINDSTAQRGATLAAVGSRLRQVLRRSDLRCRYGGDEFLLVLPETPAAGAARVAEWVRGEVEQIEVTAGSDVIRPTISVGVATSTAGEGVDGLLDRADRALYAAKAAGRNCVRATSTGPRPVTAVTAFVR
jgi:diguanylate cyclase (GGDEF)-like protein